MDGSLGGRRYDEWFICRRVVVVVEVRVERRF